MNCDIDIRMVVQIFTGGNENDIIFVRTILKVTDLAKFINDYESRLRCRQFNLQRELSACKRRLEQASEKHVLRLKDEYSLEVTLEELKNCLNNEIFSLNKKLEKVREEICWLEGCNLPQYRKPVKLSAKQIATVF